MQTLDGAGTPVAPIDSGPGPMDVLEARATLHTRAALDDAEAAVQRLVAFLEREPRPPVAAIGETCRRTAQVIEHALTQVAAIGSLGIGGDR